MPRSLLLRLLFIALLLPAPAWAYVVEMTQEQLQVMLAKGFPLKREVAFATLTFDQPRLVLEQGSNRLGLALTLLAEMPGQRPARGSGMIDGELEYHADTGEFHLRNPSVKSLSFDGLAPQYNALLQGVVAEYAAQTLPIVVLYRLDESEMRQAMARRMLKSVQVKDGKVLAELDW